VSSGSVSCIIRALSLQLSNSKRVDELYWSLQSGHSATIVRHLQDCSMGQTIFPSNYKSMYLGHLPETTWVVLIMYQYNVSNTCSK